MRKYSLIPLLMLVIALFMTYPSMASPPRPQRVDQETSQLMAQELQMVLIAVSNAPVPAAQAHETRMQLATYESHPVPRQIDLTTGTALYLVISAGVSNENNSIAVGGKILSINLSPAAYATLGIVFNTLGASGNTLSVSTDFTSPGYRFHLLFFTVQGGRHNYHIVANAQLMTGSQLQILKNSLKVSSP